MTRPLPRPTARAEWVDIAKGLSILLVVLLHTSLWLRQAGMERIPAVSALNLAVEDLRMPLFFAMSGLFAAKWLAAGWRDFLGTKAALLVWVFLLWQVPIIAYRIIGGAILPGMVPTDLATQLETWAWSPLRANAELWFLWALVVFLVLGRLLRRVPDVAVVAGAAVLSVAWSGVVVPAGGGDMRHLLGTGFYTAPPYFVFFIAAARFSRPVRDGVARVPRTVWALAALGWFWAFVRLDVLAPHRDEPWAAFAGQACGVLGGVALAVALQSLRPVARLVAHVGRHTLEVYLSHTTIVVALCCGLYLLGGPAGASGSPWLTGPWTGWTVGAVALVGVVGGLLIGRAVRAVPALDPLLQAPAGVRRAVTGRWRSAEIAPAGAATAAEGPGTGVPTDAAPAGVARGAAGPDAIASDRRS
jgi:uncharacterized membrane protein YcfT